MTANPSTELVTIDYTNYRGERLPRLIYPIRIDFAKNEWHPERQWLLDALDMDKEQRRSFALKDVHSWHEGNAVSRIECSTRLDPSSRMSLVSLLEEIARIADTSGRRMETAMDGCDRILDYAKTARELLR